MRYMLQTRGNSGKWQMPKFNNGTFPSLDLAIANACKCDEDGIFPADVRIVNQLGDVIVTRKAWFEQWRAAGMKDFRFEYEDHQDGC